MKGLLAFFGALLIIQTGSAQTAVNMSAQPNYTYTETFADYANWTFSASPANGTFSAGTGAAAWRGNDPVAIGTVPDGKRLSHSTTVFQNGGSSSGIYSGGTAMTLLITGTADNSNAIAMDFFVNFSGLNAGTLSFDWASINNLTGNRKSSLKVYTSTDGATFTELTGAAVLNFTNNAPTSGHVNFVQLPASFNNSPTAQIRFYLYNGTGGTTGNRPKLSLDNIKVTAVSSTACATPSAQATNLSLTPAYSSISGNFTAASPASQGYLVVATTNNTLSSLPVNGTSYSAGDNLGDGTVIAFGNSTGFTHSSLSPSTTYNYFIYAMNHMCSGGPLYNTTSPLAGTSTTLSSNAPCTAPAQQPTNLVFSNITTSSIRGTFTASPSTNADHYLVVRSTNSSLSSQPVNGNNYSANSTLGGGTVVTKTVLNSFNANNLTPGTTYYFFVYAVNEDNCSGGPAYQTTSPLTSSAATTIVPACTTPTTQPTALNLSPSNNAVNGYFTASSDADAYLVLYSTSSTLSNTPQDGVNYTAGSTLGNATVVSNSSPTGFIVTGLSAANTYYFFVFAKKDQCTGGPKYLTTSPLQGNATTAAAALRNYYFGNLHAHSSYSDGNKDNTALTPADDYAYAKNSLCMDYLGISEHNHAEAGMALASYAMGVNQANAATVSNFVALYGMEWGTISNGGHALVYGVNQLIGWETGNYDIYVAKGDYTGTPLTTGTTGLFKTLNDLGGNAFAMLAHPDNSDFGNIANMAWRATVDSAIVGVAIESGPAFSTNTTYNDAPTRLGHYSYYKKLLSRGYHVGPNIDHDTHYTNFGRSTYSRTAVVASSLTQNNLLHAIKNRSFYSTHDCNTKVNFTINNQVMGSITSGTTAPAISINVTDPDNPSATATIRIYYGTPASGLTPVVLDSLTNTNTFNFTDNTLAVGNTAYYYAEISMSGGYVITSPIWYTRNTNPVPLTFLSFKGNLTNERTTGLQWITTNEVNTKSFIVERSADGVNFSGIATVDAKNVAGQNVYDLIDKKPNVGYNYYRLQQVDKDGKTTYSSIIMVNLKPLGTNSITVYPNPVKNVLNLKISTTETAKAQLNITDMFGKIIKAEMISLLNGSQIKQINAAALAAGEYYVIVKVGEERIVQKFVKQ